MSEGFLGRWSRRKLGEGKREPEPARESAGGDDAGAVVPPPQPSPGGGGSELPVLQQEAAEFLPPPPGEGGGGGTAQAQATAEDLPTLDDVTSLTADSDFSRFVAPKVAPEVKNAAMKKLFADPRYNVMDGMDVYIDDYTRPDPVPESLLRQLASAKFLNLFAQEEEQNVEHEPTRDDADNPSPQSVAESPETPDAVTRTPPDADPDLRLQQDDAPAGEEPGRTAE